MSPSQFLLALKARYAVAIAVFLLTAAAVVLVSERLPKRYTAETSVMVDFRSPDPVAGVLLPSSMVPGNMSTQVEIIKSDLVARKVVKALKLDEGPAVKERWFDATHGRGRLEDWVADLLQRRLSATPSRDSNIVVIGYSASDPGRAAAIANAFANAYIESSIELKVEPARQYSKWFAEQAAVLREQVERAQSRLSEFQRKKGIVVTEESMDNELARLNELSGRLGSAQSETREAQIKQRSSGLNAEPLPEVRLDSVVAGLRTSINQLEAKLKESAGNLGSRHPQYLRMESELAELKNRLTVESSNVASGYTATSAVGRNKEAELITAIEAQKRKILNLRRERDEIAVLLRDVETAKRAYEGVTNRLNQTILESQATRTNVSVLSPANEPLELSFPKSPDTMLLLAIALGVFLAGACVFGLETFDRRIRTADDLAEMLQIPVLAVIERGSRVRRLSLPGRVPALPVK